MTTTSVPARRNGRPAARRGDLHRTVISLSAGSADDAEPGRDAGADPLLTALAGFAGRAPDGLDDRVFTRWATAPSRVGDVRVAFTADGAQFVRPTEGTDDDAFAAEYRSRFARPLRPAGRLPAGVGPSLRGTAAARPELDLGAGSPFERAVLAATRRIPPGQVRPYAWVAREAGHPAAVRAVGTVLARNPLPLLVPCHRVVRSDGALGGYMFGTGRKAELLTAEGADLDELATLARTGVHYLASDTTGIVCFPTCRDARRITGAHRHGFTTLDDARRAGYRPCRTCRPAAA
ncbi:MULTISPECIES: methylated-DNA--[protein]-cysteine S-methyltransferase [unclassified Pseudonocardia]|uniref:methylated-DNA--[protein]-cysteine S-methyltransferase n=1 Tax=unclassified Pseudonocardia TaxID=2619320 RepID=UPI0009E6758D|nr:MULTISPECIES: methylated-DNA--[protein]-cysteine S-methyltransferase [unclassified Pseudonocardia]